MSARDEVEDEATQSILLVSALHLYLQVAPRCVRQTPTSVSVDTYAVLQNLFITSGTLSKLRVSRLGKQIQSLWDR